MTKAERDFFEAARKLAKYRYHAGGHGVYCDCCCGSEEELVDAYRALLAEETSEEPVATPPVAEPKRGVDEILVEALNNPERSATYNWAIEETLRLYREEKSKHESERAWARQAYGPSLTHAEQKVRDLESELAALKPRVEKAIHYARGLNQLPDGGTAATEWIVEILEGRDT